MIRRAFLVLLFATSGCNVLAGLIQGSLETDCLDKAKGFALRDQTPGDCAVLVCDGEGGTISVDAPTDNDDGNPCTTDICAGQTPVHTPITGEVICYTGRLGSAGVGICRSGQQFCNNGVAEGVCEGEVIPVEERCDFQFNDEDCNGLSNEDGEGCFCGDGIVQQALGEECDTDPNLPPDPDCADNCKFPAICGDGVVQSGESCDDGNQIDGDGCPADCLQSIVKLSAGIGHTCALFEDGRAKCWGSNYSGQLGLGDTRHRGTKLGEMGRWLPTVDLGQGNLIADITAGVNCSCAIQTDGKLRCWGSASVAGATYGNDNIEMGDKLPVIDLGGSVKSITLSNGRFGSDDACAILQNGDVKCWGYTVLYTPPGSPSGVGLGELTLADLLPVPLGTGLKAINIASAGLHGCGVFDNGRIKCWGINSHGELGLGDVMAAGTSQETIGDALPFVDLGTGAVAKSVVVAREGYSCALLAGGSVKCWGFGKRLGLGSFQNRGDDDGEMGDALPAVDLGPGAVVTALSANNGSTCALLDNGTVKCWGANDIGQLGLGDKNPRGLLPGDMGSALPAVDLGTNAFVTAIAVGSIHACAVINHRHVKCWGANSYTGLGRSDLTSTGDEPGEMGDALPFVQLW